jgi:hypothetical protein
MCIHCHGNLFTEQLPSENPGIGDVFTDHYQATHVPSRDCLHRNSYTHYSTNYIKVDDDDNRFRKAFVTFEC